MSEQPNILNFEIKLFFFLHYKFVYFWVALKQNVNKARQTDSIRKMERYCANERTYINNRKNLIE